LVIFKKLCLTGDPGNVIRAALLKSGIKSSSTAAASFSRQWFIREPVWVVTTASSFSIFDTINQWTTGFLIKSWLHELFINGTTSDKQVKHFQHKNTFDFTSTVLAESSVSNWVNVVKSVTVKNQVRLTSTSSWKVLNFPWHTTVVTSLFFVVEHATVITISKFLTEMIDTVDWFSVTSSVVVFKVAPATVFVDSVEIVTGEDVRDGSRLWSIGFDQRSNVPVGEVVHLVFHGLEAGMGVSDKKSASEL
jgi:hypothetical protein